MTQFRQALLDELMTRVTDPSSQPAAAPDPAPAPRRGRGLVLAVGGLAVLAVVAGWFTIGAPTTPAYAVTTQSDGTVTVTFNHIADPAEVNRSLREAGVRAIVMLPKPAESCPVADRGTPVLVGLASANSTSRAIATLDEGRANVARLRPDQILAGTVLVLVPMDHGPRGEPGLHLRLGHYREPGPKCVTDDWS
ncbi:hypothetical protein ACWDV4_22595 [Micromonospora sp. NPDC003197]